jgi:multidrug efflux pump subunit AcrB
MNSKQKKSVIISVVVAIISIFPYLYYGLNTLTKTSVIVEKKDELFDTVYKVTENKFIWGLDLTLLVMGVSLLIGGLLYYFYKDKDQTQKN